MNFLFAPVFPHHHNSCDDGVAAIITLSFFAFAIVTVIVFHIIHERTYKK
jgi:hypothetical protein